MSRYFATSSVQECPGLVELEPDRYGADLLKSGLYGGVFQRFVQCGVQSFQDVPRDTGGGAKAEPAVELVLRQARLRRRHRIRQRRQPGISRDRERDSSVGPQRSGHVRIPGKAELHRAGDQVRPELGDVAIGDVSEFDRWRLGRNTLRPDAATSRYRPIRSSTPRALSLRASMRSLTVVTPSLLLAVTTMVKLANGEIRTSSLRIEAKLLVERQIGGHRTRSRADQRIPIGSGIGRQRGAEISAGARLVFHDDRLPEQWSPSC